MQLGGTVVSCDARSSREVIFVSSGAVEGRWLRDAARAKLIASPRTTALLEARGLTSGGVSLLPVPLGRPLSLGALRLELFPSGRLPGAAQLLLVEPAGRRTVYAGLMNPRSDGSGLAEAAEVRGADVLVVEAPLAALPGALPPRAQALGELCERVRDGLAAGRTPVVLTPPLGVAQEAQRALAEAGVALSAHAAIRAFSQAVGRVGAALPSSVLAAPRAGAKGGGAALLWPLELAHAPALDRVLRVARPLRIALSGQALDPRFAERLGADAAIALADHADLPSLVEYVRHSGARSLHVTAGFGPALVEALRPLGVAVHPLGPPRQMELGW